MRRFRVLLTTWQDFAAGSIQSVQYLAEGLARRGHEVLVACPADGVLGRRLRASGVPVIDFEFRRGWSPRSARALARLIEERRIELVDAQESRDRKAAILARTLFGARAKLVITRRQESSSFVLQDIVYAAAADRVIAISHGVARGLARRGMPARRISVVHTGLDPRRVQAEVPTAEVDRIRARLGLDPVLPTIGVVARRKDQETLLRALAVLGRPANAVFIGIERDAELAALEAALPEGSRVAYTGFVDHVPAYYRLLDVKVLTTRAEGLSQALLEAAWLGVPVVTAAVGGTPEVVVDGRTGLHYPPGDAEALAAALARMLDDAELRERCVSAGRVRVRERFDAEALARGTEAVYARVLGAGAGSGAGPGSRPSSGAGARAVSDGEE